MFCVSFMFAVQDSVACAAGPEHHVAVAAAIGSVELGIPYTLEIFLRSS